MYIEFIFIPGGSFLVSNVNCFQYFTCCGLGSRRSIYTHRFLIKGRIISCFVDESYSTIDSVGYSPIDFEKVIL